LENAEKTLKEKFGATEYAKLAAINNPELHSFIAKYVQLMEPQTAFVFTGSKEDLDHVRKRALERGEEKRLAIPGHTIHFDGLQDQGRAKDDTQILLSKPVDFGPDINVMDRQKGLGEIHEFLKGISKTNELYVCFFCLGPAGSEFAIPALQITDSAYVVHSESLLYRNGYEEFKRLGAKARFFKFVHSQGELEGGVTKNISKRRMYMDIEGEAAYSVNTQYAGNSVGLKKIAMRLAIARAAREGWLTEHMFVVGVLGPGRMTYFSGAFPSLCGKTSTATLECCSIVGDDIAYLRNKAGEVRAVNVEKGVFGIIDGVNSKDDPVLWEALHGKNEVIFSNVLVTDGGGVYWNGKDGEVPKRGVNYSGEWRPGKKSADGKDILPSHKNARFTIDLASVRNLDPHLDDPKGVVLSGIIYGGRDASTGVPVEEAFEWNHGVVTKGATLESETTMATLGKEGVRSFNPMSNVDFLSIPIGEYVESHLKFGAGLGKPPKIFSVNYFLRDAGGSFLNGKTDKRVWLKWMELRTRGEAGAVRIPTGLIPKYADLRRLFREELDKEYSEEHYAKQFTVKIPENLAKIERMLKVYRENVAGAPRAVFEELEAQKKRLEAARSRDGDYVAPEKFPDA